ncbi:hypothetical protein [Burkholderia sp. BCC0044]|uniref:hypothetical protein n=1 Tax=Burkholderia sp. BCC0044 TaxID=2676295 RepID=UPI00158D5556|nr:hypothetical protein [Burkholderia sp. BCC0044]
MATHEKLTLVLLRIVIETSVACQWSDAFVHGAPTDAVHVPLPVVDVHEMLRDVCACAGDADNSRGIDRSMGKKIFRECLVIFVPKILVYPSDGEDRVIRYRERRDANIVPNPSRERGHFSCR